MKKPVSVIKRELVYDGYFKMRKFTFKHRLFSGGESAEVTREVFERGHAVAVLLYDPARDEVVLVEQFRIGAVDCENPWLVELVAGMVEEDEDLEDVARREAMEEAGATVGRLSLIGDYYNSAGGCTEMTTVYYAEIDASMVEGIHGCENEQEDIRVVKLSKATFFSQLESNVFSSGSLLIAGYWFKARQDK